MSLVSMTELSEEEFFELCRQCDDERSRRGMLPRKDISIGTISIKVSTKKLEQGLSKLISLLKPYDLTLRDTEKLGEILLDMTNLKKDFTNENT